MVFVIGWGNTLRGDDGVGPAVAERVGACDPHVRSLPLAMLTPELAPQLAGASLVVFVDASVDAEPGQIHVEALGDDGAANVPGHLLGARALMGLARGLYGSRARAVQVSVGGAAFDIGADMSPEVAAAVPVAADAVLGIVRAARGGLRSTPGGAHG